LKILSQCRKEALYRQGLGTYAELVMHGDFHKVCVTCRCIQEMRSHHCKLCGRCISRLDHHCPWIDNCVGIHNQRSFVAFVATLLCMITMWYGLAGKYVFDSLKTPRVSQLFYNVLPPYSSFLGLVKNVLFLLTGAMNLVWLGFSGALLARSVAYMMVNVTAYEVISLPPHVKRRFPHTDSGLWYFRDCTVFSMVRRCFGFWSKSSKWDMEDFNVKPDYPQQMEILQRAPQQHSSPHGYTALLRA